MTETRRICPNNYSYLPSSTPVGRSAEIERVLLVFEDMRLALECKSNGLKTGRDQPDYYTNLIVHKSARPLKQCSQSSFNQP